MRPLTAALAAALLLLTSCTTGFPGSPDIPPPMGGPADPVPMDPSAADQPTPEPVAPHEEWPASPAFAAHFTDPLYRDAAAELAPFGSDEGADLLAFALESRDQFGSRTTVRELLTTVDFAWAIDDPDGNGPDVDGFVIAGGFALILITGRIDEEGRRLTLEAIERSWSWFAEQRPRELAVMHRDLTAFPAG